MDCPTCGAHEFEKACKYCGYEVPVEERLVAKKSVLWFLFAVSFFSIGRLSYLYFFYAGIKGKNRTLSRWGLAYVAAALLLGFSGRDSLVESLAFLLVVGSIIHVFGHLIWGLFKRGSAK